MESPKIIHTHMLHEREERFTPSFLLKIIGIGIVLMAVVAGLLWWSVQRAQSPQGFMADLQTKVEFPLFYPSQLSGTMKLDRTKFGFTKEVVTTTYTYEGNKHLVVSMQARAKSFDASTFQPTSEFTASIGRAYLADLPTRTTAAVVGEKSWVLINAPDKIAIDQLTAFINALLPL